MKEFCSLSGNIAPNPSSPEFFIGLRDAAGLWRCGKITASRMLKKLCADGAS